MEYLKVFSSLIRLKNLLILAFIQILVCYRFIPNNIILESSIIISSTLLIMAGGNLINDYYDLEIDQINKPNKKLYTSIFSSSTLFIIYALLNIIGLIPAFFISIKLGISLLGAISILWLYSYEFKKTVFLGNLIVSSLLGSALLYIGIYYVSFDSKLWMFSAFSFVMNLSRELIKDIEDIYGDKQGGCETLPILIGIKHSKILLYTYLSLINSLLGFFLISQPFEWLFSLWAFTIFVFSLILTWFIIKSNDDKDFGKISSFCKKMMIVGTFGIIFT